MGKYKAKEVKDLSDYNVYWASEASQHEYNVEYNMEY